MAGWAHELSAHPALPVLLVGRHHVGSGRDGEWTPNLEYNLLLEVTAAMLGSS